MPTPKNGRKFPDAPKESKKADSVSISRATNGFTLRCSYPYKSTGKNEVAYDSDSNKETVFESKEALLEHLKGVL